MAEVTRVPLQPIAKGSLTKLWLGVIVAILIGAGLAWSAMPKGFSIDTLVAGEGPNPEIGDMVFVKYKGSLADTGEVFDEHQDIPLPVEGIFPEGSPFPVEEGATIPGFFKGLQQVQKGGTYKLYIPSEEAYGAEERRDPATGEVRIPANADLVFDIEVIDFMSQEEFQRKIGMLQAAMGAGPLGPPPADVPEGAQAIPQPAP